MKKPFYGWVIVGVSFLIGVTEAGVFQNILSIFMKPMANDFGWSRTAVTGAISIGSICGGLISPFVGSALDRYGPRMLAFWGIALLSGTLFALMFINHLWQLYLFFGIGRMIAMGALGLIITVSVSNWFVLKRGRALGITWIGERVGSTLLPVMIQFLILAYGWRMAWGWLGLLVFVMAGLPALLLRRRPEDMGLLPDGCEPICLQDMEHGHPKAENGSNDPVAVADPFWTRDQATRTGAFWTLTLITCLLPLIQAGINFHIFPFLTDQGLNPRAAVLVLAIIGGFSAIGSLTWGMLADKVNVKTLLTLNVIGSGFVFLLFFWTVGLKLSGGLGTSVVYILAAIHGSLHGGRNTIISIIWSVFFGRKALGSIYGFSIPFKLVANAFGPIFAAVCFDLYGNYLIPFSFFVGVFFITGAISSWMKPPALPAICPRI